MTKVKQFVTTNISPYGLAKVLSEALQEAGIDRNVPPQYLYGMTRGEDPRLKTHLTETGKQSVTAEDANEFVVDFIERTKERAAAKAKKALESVEETIE